MALIVEYHEEIEADLLPEHDLLDLWRGGLSFRRLELLIRNLPPATSALIRAVNPDLADIASWEPVNYQLADLYDATARAHFKDPKPYPRPGVVIKDRNRAAARRRALVERHEAQRKARGGGNG